MKKFICVTFSLAIFCSYFILELIFNFGSIFKEQNIKIASSNIPISYTKTNKPEDLYWNASLDTIYELAEENDISKQEIKKVLESKEAQKFTNAYLNNLANSIINQKEQITDEEIKTYFDKYLNEYLINSNINDSTKNKIYNFASTNSYKITESLPNTEDINNSLNPEIVETIKSFFNVKIKIILILIIIVSSIGLILLQFDKQKWLLYIGITILISSIINLIFTYTFLPIISSLLSVNLYIISALIKNFINIVSNIYLKTNICLIVVSIIILIIYNIFKYKQKIK